MLFRSDMQLLGAAGIGVVVRDSTGEVLAAMSEIIPLPSSVVVLETLAARRAVVFLKELDLHSSVFEGDSEKSISAIKNQSIHAVLNGPSLVRSKNAALCICIFARLLSYHIS